MTGGDSSSGGERAPTDPLVYDGVTKTDLYCHNCSKNFIAAIDYAVDGNHEIHCPYCDHKHFRLVAKGKVTEERWASGATTTVVPKNRIWTHNAIHAQTSSASMFIRDLWLRRDD